MNLLHRTIITIQTFFLLYRMVRTAITKGSDCQYSAIVNDYGIPQVTMIIATGREAWRVTQYATELHLTK